MRSKPNWKDCITSHFFVHQSYQKRKACLWLCKYYSILLLRSIDVSCLSCFSRVPSVEWDYRLGILVPSQVSEFGLRLILQTLYFLKRGSIYDMWQKNTVLPTFMNIQLCKKDSLEVKKLTVQGDQDHFYAKEMLISPSILKLHKNPWIWEGLRTIHFI